MSRDLRVVRHSVELVLIQGNLGRCEVCGRMLERHSSAEFEICDERAERLRGQAEERAAVVRFLRRRGFDSTAVLVAMGEHYQEEADEMSAEDFEGGADE